MRLKQDDERRRLTDMRNLLKTTPVLEKEVQNVACIPVSSSLLNVLVFFIFYYFIIIWFLQLLCMN